ncbi:unnamed protein product [Symbiodinium sp. CCMP2592]|nr:unnamed protein product [Symbiodinium sp. CCMP2592]
MQVLVDHCLGLPEDAIVSVRCGGMRRQAPLETLVTQPLKFPATLDGVSEPLKIDVLQPIATTRLVLHPHEELYSIGFEESTEMVIGLRMQSQDSQAENGSAPSGQESTGPNFKDAAASAKDYLEQHGLLRYVQSLLHAVIQVRPRDPYAYMIEQLSAAQSKTRTLEKLVSRPGSALPERARTPVPPREPPPSCSPTRPRPPTELLHVGAAAAAAATTSTAPKEAESAPLTGSTRAGAESEEGHSRPVRLPEEAPALPALPPLPPLPLPSLPTASTSEDLRLLLKNKLEEAYNSGRLEDVVANAVASPPPLATAHQPAETKETEVLEESSGPTRELDAFSCLKGNLKSVLFDSMDTGALQNTLAAVAESQKTLKISEDLDKVAAIKTKLRAHLLEAVSSGALGPVLQSYAKPLPAPKPSATSKQPQEESVQDLRQKMRDLLQESVSTGSLQEALDHLSLTKQLPEPAATSQTASTGSAPEKSAKKAGEDRTRLKAREEEKMKSDVFQLKAQMLARAETALDSGELLGILQSLRKDQDQPGPSQVRNSADQDQAKRTQGKSDSSSQKTEVEKATDSRDDLFTLKGQILAQTEAALDSGELESILESLRQPTAKQQPSPSAQQKAKADQDRGRLTHDEANSGAHEKEGRDQDFGNDLFKLKAQLLTRAEKALDSGELAGILQSLRKDQGEPGELAVIKKKLRGLLEDAAESGKLQGTLQHLQLGEEPLSTGDVLDLKSLHAELTVMKQEKVTLSQTVNQLTAEMDVLKKENDDLARMLSGLMKE